MAAGRSADAAGTILARLNVPYTIAAPLLIQDVAGWTAGGVSGLQAAVLYALPELDGAAEAVVLGGLVGDRILLVPDRLRRLTGRLRARLGAAAKARRDRVVAVVLYGYPPGAGAAGTAALLDVPASLDAVLRRLASDGYDVGDALERGGAALVAAAAAADAVGSTTVPAPGGVGVRDAVAPVAGERALVDPDTLRGWLGPVNAGRLDASWGPDLGSWANPKTFGGGLTVAGVRCGNVWVGVQPPLGVAGDPMQLMFQRDAAPHPQYCAFYRWLEEGLGADAVVHFGYV